MTKNYALILGVSSGIGAECAKELASKGLNIIGLYMRSPKDKISQLVEDITSHNVKVNLVKMNACNYDKMEELLLSDAFKGIKIKTFIHSLAFGSMKPFIANIDNQINRKNIEMTLDVMSNSIIYWTQHLYNNNFFIDGSQIIGMTSAGGRKQWPSYGAVSMAKSALESACRQLSVELASTNIAVNTIQAGVTDTPALRKIPGSDNMIKNIKKINPRKRLTTPKDIAEIVTLIGLSYNTWMTGNIIRVDGGEDLIG